MRKPCLILALLPLLLTVPVYAQFTLSGKITTTDNKPLQYVSVELLKDTVVLRQLASDKEGKYQLLNLPAAQYLLRISYINFGKQEIGFLLRSDTLINVPLTFQAATLKEVTIDARKPLIERKVDRLIFNVAASSSAIGANGLEVLGKTPGVRVDNNSISIVGKSEVGVMIDDRLVYMSGDALAEMLKSIPAETIASIEVITNPPARYDAHGNSGLINIIKKRNREPGYNGMLNVGVSQATYTSAFGNLSLNYNRKKFQSTANISIAEGAQAPYTNSDAFLPDYSWRETSERKEFTHLLRGSLSIEQTLTPKTALALSYNGGRSTPDVREEDRISLYSGRSVLDSQLVTRSFTDVGYFTQGVNVHLRHNIDSLGKKLTVDGDWFRNDFDRDRDFTNRNYFADGTPTTQKGSSARSDNQRTTSLYTLNTVLDLPTKKIAFSTGFKLSFIQNGSNIQFAHLADDGLYKPDPAFTNDFRYNENIQAVFGNLSGKIKKWNYQAGLRAEYTSGKGYTGTGTVTSRNDYFNLFPTFYLSWKPNVSSVYAFNYGKRINRPGFQVLNPFRLYMSPYSYTEGNPWLQPSISHNIELSHTYKSIYTATISWSYNIDLPGYLQRYDNTGIMQVVKPENMLTTSQYVFSNSIIYNKIKWLESYNSVYVYYSHASSVSPDTYPVVEGWGGSVATRNTIFFDGTKNFAGSIDANYYFPETSGLSRNKSSWNLDLGFRFAALKKKMQVTISGRDIFRTRVIRTSQVINNNLQKLEANNDSRRCSLSVRYSFGGTKVRAAGTYSGSSPEQGRSN